MRQKLRERFGRTWQLPYKFFKREGKASLLELFYDLIIVSVLGVLTSIMIMVMRAPEHSVFMVMFILLQAGTILLFWRINLYNSMRFEVVDFRHRAFVFAQMIALAALVVGLYSIEINAEHALEAHQHWVESAGHEGHEFISWNHVLYNSKAPMVATSIGYMAFLLVVIINQTSIVVWIKDWYIKKQMKVILLGRILNAILGTAYVTVSFTISDQDLSNWVGIAIWIANIITFVSTGVISNSRYFEFNTPDTDTELVQERYAILTMVFYGEFMISIFEADAHLIVDGEYWRAALMLLGGFTFVIMLFLLYSDLLNFPDIVDRPTNINIYTFSSLVMLLAFIPLNAGFNVYIESKDVAEADVDWKWVARLFALGIIMWHTSSAPVWYSLKKFDHEHKYVYPGWIQFVLYTGIIHVWSYVWAAFVFPEHYIYVQMGVGLAYWFFDIFIVLISFSQPDKFQKKYDEKIIEFRKKDNEWIERVVVPRIDKEHHAKYNYRLNRFSRHIRNQGMRDDFM